MNIAAYGLPIAGVWLCVVVMTNIIRCCIVAAYVVRGDNPEEEVMLEHVESNDFLAGDTDVGRHHISRSNYTGSTDVGRPM